MNEKRDENQAPQESAITSPVTQRADGQQPDAAQASQPGEAQATATKASHEPSQEEQLHTIPTVTSISDPRNLRPKTGPIVWGVLVLAFCVYTASQMVAPGSVNGTTFVIAATITLGVLLLAIGAAVIVRSSRAQRRP